MKLSPTRRQAVIKCEHFMLTKIAHGSLEYHSYLPSAGPLVVFASMLWRQLLCLMMFLALMDSGGKTSACFPTRSLFFSYGLIFDPFMPLGIITLQCWSYLGLPNN